MIHVIASIDANPGRREAFLAAFRELVPAVRAGPAQPLHHRLEQSRGQGLSPPGSQ